MNDKFMGDEYFKWRWWRWRRRWWCPPPSSRRLLGYEERRMRRQVDFYRFEEFFNLFQETEHPHRPTMQCPVGQEEGCQGTACEVVVISFSQRQLYLTHWSVLEDRSQSIACEVITVSQDDDIIKCGPLWCWLIQTHFKLIWSGW